jgi:hypothetical protein
LIFKHASRPRIDFSRNGFLFNGLPVNFIIYPSLASQLLKYASKPFERGGIMITEIVLGSFVFGYGVLALSLLVSAGRQLVTIKGKKSR